MDLFTTGLTFVIVWWLVLFMVLPFGTAPAEDVQPGTARSAPAKPRILIKLLVTTLLAMVLTAVAVWVVQSELIEVRPPR